MLSLALTLAPAEWKPYNEHSAADVNLLASSDGPTHSKSKIRRTTAHLADDIKLKP